MPHLSDNGLCSLKRHACHAKHRGANSTQNVCQPPTSIKVYKVPHLSCKWALKCHACYEKRRGANSTQNVCQLPSTLYEGLKSATPVTQIDPEVSKAPCLSQFDPRCLPASVNLYKGLQSVARVRQMDSEVCKIPRLSCKTPRRFLSLFLSFSLFSLLVRVFWSVLVLLVLSCPFCARPARRLKDRK